MGDCYKDEGPAEAAIGAMPSLTRERLAFVINNTRSMADRAERVLKHLDAFPEVDDDLAKLFNITPMK